MSKIVISHIIHRNKNCLRLNFDFDRELILLLKKLGALWSQQLKSWYIPYDKDTLEKVQNTLSKENELTYIPEGEDYEPFKKETVKAERINPYREFCSLFISYSFEDKEFANALNSQLKAHGLKTFLWEKDAPFGNALTDIMYENIHKYDKVLFIASENSIKSKACHFELSQAREKNAKTWKNVLFPIHIDNFLFEVRKTMIRPLENQDEYWKNINELRLVNSADFCQFKATLDEKELGLKVKTLIESLTK